MAITHFGMGGWCTRTVGSSLLKPKQKPGNISRAATRRAKSFIDLALGATRRPAVCLGAAMSALGQKRTFASQNVMSALPRKRTFESASWLSAKGQNRLCGRETQYPTRGYNLQRLSYLARSHTIQRSDTHGCAEQGIRSRGEPWGGD